jgi:hypothetical protein
LVQMDKQILNAVFGQVLLTAQVESVAVQNWRKFSVEISKRFLVAFAESIPKFGFRKAHQSIHRMEQKVRRVGDFG